MATYEYNGLMTVKDAAGNKYLLYPITKAECVDGLEEALAAKAASSHIHAAGDITSGTLSTARGGTGNANGTVAKLTTARTIRTNLGSTSTASFDGSANVTPGVTGTLPIANGGTGQTSAAKALYALINGSSALAYSGAAAGDFLALLDASAATGKKISLENLINYMQLLGGVPKIATGSYTGTGTYGADNPCSLTFNFVPTLVIVSCWRVVSGTTTRSVVGIFLRDDYGMRITQNSNYASRILYAAWAETSLSWYSVDGDDDQLNYEGTSYHYLAIG